MSLAPTRRPSIILASQSPYRRELLSRLGLEFQPIAADIDESHRSGELPEDYVQRLAKEKAQKIADQHQTHITIGSDQCAVLNDKIIGKPGTRENAIRQLAMVSGNTVDFLTAACILYPENNEIRRCLVPFRVKFRRLGDAEIERYVDLEQPFDCAGSFKSEGLGIALCNAMEGDDPTALIGLPLIQLSQMLRELGVDVP